MALLEIDGLTTHLVLPRRTVRAVDGVSFQIEAGGGPSAWSGNPAVVSR